MNLSDIMYMKICHRCCTRACDLSDSPWKRQGQMRTNSVQHPAEEKTVSLKTETRNWREGRKSPAPGPHSATKPPRKVNKRAGFRLQPPSEPTPRYQPARRRPQAQMVSAFSRLLCVCSPPPPPPLSFLLLFCEMRWGGDVRPLLG